ncbi:molybdate ABC transporter substrate-binding protein [Bacillus sp. P14.5]|uniref:molybdate ABC transporter substrate-binding protein n=1 Tax=Bacillus sp. P14.5 TaxID=1983400 RepID=UPI0013B05070|nr:molybdate ABC transporter substrate-binding protein [Bacillus sp. P14.5]
MNKSIFILLLACILLLSACTSTDSEKVELTISAAASLKDSLKEVKDQFETEYPEIKLSYNFGSSGSLRKQIDQGAPIDIFLSASEKDYQALADSGAVSAGDRLFSNSLVLVVRQDSQVSGLNDVIERNFKLSIGTPETVPAGFYAKQALENMGVWKEALPRTVYAKDVRHVMTLLDHGAADAGIVYESDAMAVQDSRVIRRFDAATHSPILYWGGLVEAGEHKEESMLFLEFLEGQRALKIFERYGFETETNEFQ